MSFSKAQDLIRLAQIAAARRGGVSLEDICEEFGVSHRTAQRMTDALEETFGNVEAADGDGRPDEAKRVLRSLLTDLPSFEPARILLARLEGIQQ